MPVTGGYDGPCINKFGKCFHAGAKVAEKDIRALQGIIPDMVIDARDCEHGPFPSQNDVVGQKSLVEHKTLASLLLSVQARARKVLADIKKRGRARCSAPRIYLCTRAGLVPRVHHFGHRAFWQPFQRFQPFGGVHCARAGDADHEASGHKSSSRVCGSSACFGAAHWPSHFSRLGVVKWKNVNCFVFF